MFLAGLGGLVCSLIAAALMGLLSPLTSVARCDAGSSSFGGVVGGVIGLGIDLVWECSGSCDC